MSTVSEKLLFFFTALLCLVGWGCAVHALPDLGEAQQAARSRLAGVRSAEYLKNAARIQVEHAESARLIAAAAAARNTSAADAVSDPALKELDDAIIFAHIALSPAPAQTAEFWTKRLIDMETAALFARFEAQKDTDTLLNLQFCTNWEEAKLRAFDFRSLGEGISKPFPSDRESGDRLAREGSSAPFRAAEELYRNPAAGRIAQAERFRETLLNGHIFRSQLEKSPAKRKMLQRLIRFRSDLLKAGKQ